MQELDAKDLDAVVGGGMMEDIGYVAGYAIGYVLGGGAGRDLGNWLYDQTH